MEYIPNFHLRNRTHERFVTLMSCINAETIKQLTLYLHFACKTSKTFCLVESKLITFDIVSTYMMKSNQEILYTPTFSCIRIIMQGSLFV